MPSQWNKFYLLCTVGGPNPTVDDMYYHWAVIHTVLFLATPCPIENFVRYAQNFVNPDVPDEARLIRKHPTINYRTFADHWSNTWKNVEEAVIGPSHRNRMGRHHFGDISTVKAFFGRGGPVYKSADFKHPAAVTIGHWLGLPEGVSRRDAVANLEVHKSLIVNKLRDFGKAVKYTLDICDDDLAEEVTASQLNNFPWKGFFAVEVLHFNNKHDGLEFTEGYQAELRESYASFINLETSHSVYGIERIVLDFTNENPSTKTPKPVYFMDENSIEYKMQHNDWKSYEPSFDLLKETKWESFQTNSERDETAFVKALDHEGDWVVN